MQQSNTLWSIYLNKWGKRVTVLFWVVSRILDEVKDGDVGTKISSISGAHRKRKWEEEDDEEDEQVEEESDDLETSSEDEMEVTEKNECTAATTSTQENKQEVKEEQKKEEENEKKTLDKEKIQSEKPSQPAIFVPVDRSPEIQVCACAWSLYVSDPFLTVCKIVTHNLFNFRKLGSNFPCYQRSRSSWRRSEKILVSSYVERQEVERPRKCPSFCMKLAMLRRLSSFVTGYLLTMMTYMQINES